MSDVTLGEHTNANTWALKAGPDTVAFVQCRSGGCYLVLDGATAADRILGLCSGPYRSVDEVIEAIEAFERRRQ
jgi:hypothetical protein